MASTLHADDKFSRIECARIADNLYPVVVVDRFVEAYQRDGVKDMGKDEKKRWLHGQKSGLKKLKKVRG